MTLTHSPSRNKVWLVSTYIKCDALQHLWKKGTSHKLKLKDSHEASFSGCSVSWTNVRAHSVFTCAHTCWYSDTEASPSRVRTVHEVERDSVITGKRERERERGGEGERGREGEREERRVVCC